MARKTCLMSSRQSLHLISVCFATFFLIQRNGSLITGFRPRYTSNRAVPCFRRPKSSTALGIGSSDDDTSSTNPDQRYETPALFFADRDAGASENSDNVDEANCERDGRSNIYSEDDRTDEKSQKGILPEVRGKENMAEETKGEGKERIDDEEEELQFLEWREKTIESVENVIRPLSEIKDGVPSERIKGAAIAATALTLLASKGVLASSAVGLSAAYISISNSVAGDFLRTVGGVTWDVTETTSKLVDQLGIMPKFGEVDRSVENKYKRRKLNQLGSEVGEGELAFIEAGDDDLSRVLKEAESVIGEADAVIAKAEREQKEKVKRSIEEELKKIAEEARIDEQERIVDEITFRSEGEDEAKIPEKDAINKEETLNADAEEKEQIVEEEQIIKKAMVKAADEEVEDENDYFFEDDQFITALELAQEGIEGKIVGVDDIITDYSAKADWDTAGELANELRQDIDSSSEAEDGDVEESKWVEDGERDGVSSDIDYSDGDGSFDSLDTNDEENPDDFADIDFEALERAAREAVEAFERDVQKANAAALSKKEVWTDSMVEQDDEQDPEFDFEDEDVDEGTVVEADQQSAMDISNPLPKDWSSLKVVELKEELKKRGLKTSGKKADLVTRLEKSYLEMLEEIEMLDVVEKNSFEFDSSDENIEVTFKELDFEELGRQVRKAVEMTEANFDEEPTEEMLELEIEMGFNGEFLEEPKSGIDFSKMTVAQLKDECRQRALKVGGRKAELIERIENSISDSTQNS